MENTGFFKNNFLKLSHLPTIMLIIGYVVYWLELYFIRRGHGLTSGLSWILFILFSIFLFFLKVKSLRGWIVSSRDNFTAQQRTTKVFLWFSFGVIFFMLLVILCASLLPIHLTQEFDALNYHYTIPRQHLIFNSFKHIQWSHADLFLSPINFALAPYWLVTSLPNKFPQFLFLLPFAIILANLVKRFSMGNLLNMCLMVFAFFGSHFIGVQMGTAMLDIVMAYLFFAVLDSFLEGAIFMCAVELVFFFWAKSFTPIQCLLVLTGMVSMFFMAKRAGFRRFDWVFAEGPVNQLDSHKIKKLFVVFIICSFFVGGPFVAKSLYYSGTPVFPLAPGIVNLNKNIDKESLAWKSMVESSKVHIGRGKAAHGYGRSPIDFLKHLWLIAVPDKGVTNKYDYPVGLVYLLFAGPFLYMLARSFKKREFAVLPILAVMFWGVWWFGSQQTRFLYVPVFLIILSVLAADQMPSKTFLAAILIALVLTALSVFGAHKRDLFRRPAEVLRAKDKQILRMNTEYFSAGRKDAVILDYYDVAFASFPVIVVKEDLPWVMLIN